MFISGVFCGVAKKSAKRMEARKKHQK